MAVTSDDESFLGRWSRRKHAARRGEPLVEPTPPAAAAPVASAAPAPSAAPSDIPEPAVELPSIDSLKGIESDYQAFLRPEVDQATRSAALKKLFSDPHFNQMDGLDVYIDDYSNLAPLSSATLRLLNQARNLGLFDEEKDEQQAEPQAKAVAHSLPDAEVSQPPAVWPAAGTQQDSALDESAAKRDDA